MLKVGTQKSACARRQVIASPEPERSAFQYLLAFNDLFGNIDGMTATMSAKILEILHVSKDEKYRNAMKNSDKQNARMESERALQSVIFNIMADNMELFKQFNDNMSFKKWLSDLVFNLTYNPEGKPFELPGKQDSIQG